MIPLRDVNPSRTIPVVNYSLIALNAAVFFFELSLGGRGVNGLVASFGLVPARLTDALAVRDIGLVTILPAFTSMFLHGGWMHIIGNMLFLWVFGDNVEDRFGHLRYGIFYIISGLSAAFLQVWMNPDSTVPMIGASGAIAGVLGAYVVMFPRAKVVTLIPIIFFFPIVEIPAFLFLGIWFLMQMISGYFSLGLGGDAGGVAWWAHIGGFGAGLVLSPFFRKRYG